MSDEYEHMGPGELLARLEDWMRVATDRGARIGELEAERDRFDAALRLVYFHLGPPQPRVLDPADVAGLVERAMNERDHLQAVVNADPVLVARLADLDAQAIAELRARAEAAEAERDRLRARVDDVTKHRDRLQTELRRQALQTISDEDQYDENYRTRLAAEAERDRLRAVVDAARMAVAGVEFANPGGVTEPIPINRLADLKAALDRLDVSPTMGGNGASADGPGSHVVAVALASPADDQGVGTGNPGALDTVDPTSPTYDPDQAGGEPWEPFDDFYTCPDHIATGGYEACCACGGWADDDPDRGRLCTEARP